MIPALFTRIVGAPSSASTRATASATAAASATFAPTAIARPPASVIAATVVGAVRRVEVEHGDGVAVGGEPLRGRGADAARGAGDDGGSGHGVPLGSEGDELSQFAAGGEPVHGLVDARRCGRATRRDARAAGARRATGRRSAGCRGSAPPSRGSCRRRCAPRPSAAAARRSRARRERAGRRSRWCRPGAVRSSAVSKARAEPAASITSGARMPRSAASAGLSASDGAEFACERRAWPGRRRRRSPRGRARRRRAARPCRLRRGRPRSRATPGAGRPALMTAPPPVSTAQPSSAAISGGTSASTGTTEVRLTTAWVAKRAHAEVVVHVLRRRRPQPARCSRMPPPTSVPALLAAVPTSHGSRPSVRHPAHSPQRGRNVITTRSPSATSVTPSPICFDDARPPHGRAASGSGARDCRRRR